MFGVAKGANTRAAVAGRVVAYHGLAAGITDGMVAEVNAEFGKPNDIESGICHRYAWHAVTAGCQSSRTLPMVVGPRRCERDHRLSKPTHFDFYV